MTVILLYHIAGCKTEIKANLTIPHSVGEIRKMYIGYVGKKLKNLVEISCFERPR
jgi:hypothetical protein